MSVKRFTPNKIERLKKNEVFVFGSNIQGEHVGGAAAFANKVFGAKFGCGFGFADFSCSTYAIPTCIRVWGDVTNPFRITKPFDSVLQIKLFVDAFINEASHFSGKVFYVTKIGCGIAGFKVSEVAELFRKCLYMDNVILPIEFVEHLLYSEVVGNLMKRGLIGGKDYDDDYAMAFVMERISGRHSLDEILDEFESIKN